MVKFGILAGMALLLAACTPAAESAQQAGVTTRNAMQDNAAAWRNLFTYSPRDKRPQLPQTRYCYQMQADIVCYDSPQPGMTAKMTGYQDGSNISWVQPGGGSLGASGGEPTAPHDAKQVQVSPTRGISAPVVPTYPGTASGIYEVQQAPAQPAPFATGASDYVTP